MAERKELLKDVFYVGIKDYNRRMFDALVPLPYGTSYNSYLIKAEKPALIDTVNPGFEEAWIKNIKAVLEPEEIAYVIMNHAEPDHAGSIPCILKLSPQAKLITSVKGKDMAMKFYRVPEERIIAVKDNEEISLGDKTLKFIEAPMLHWPETMFTYLKEENVLFTCDFMGFHTSSGFYDDDFKDLEFHAKRYYGEIMMPFSIMGKKALSKISGLNISLICPSHGPVHKNPDRILSLYRSWTNSETKQKVIIIYVTMWQNTEKMIDVITDKLLSNGIEVARHNLLNADIGDIAADLVDSRAIVFGSPTVLNSMHPMALYGISLVKALKPPLKYAVLISSYGWLEAAIKEAKSLLSSSGIEIVAEKAVNRAVQEEDLREVEQIADDLIDKLKEKVTQDIR